mgnify:CR=1 FL=1
MGMHERLGDFQYDVLKEIGNIGAGHAATALSHLLGKPIGMSVPHVSVLSFEQVFEALGGSEEPVVAVFLRVVGDSSGNMFFIIKPDSAKHLLHHLAGLEVNESGDFSDMELSALCEIGNILTGTYLTSLADFTRLLMVPTVPSVAVDMLGAVLSFGILNYGVTGDHVLMIDTAFTQGQVQVGGNFLYIPDPESFPVLFRALGVPFE